MKKTFENNSKKNSVEYCFKGRTLETNINGVRRVTYNVWIEDRGNGVFFYTVDTEKNKIEPFFKIVSEDRILPGENVLFVNTIIGWVEIK